MLKKILSINPQEVKFLGSAVLPFAAMAVSKVFSPILKSAVKGPPERMLLWQYLYPPRERAILSSIPIPIDVREGVHNPPDRGGHPPRFF